MPIGKLYNSKNVVVGQAACLIAPANTPVPDIAKSNLSDPFDLAPWGAYTIATGTATSFTLTYGGSTTTVLTVAAITAAMIKAALEALPTVGVGNAFVSGAAGAWSVSFADSVTGGGLVLTGTPTPAGGGFVVSNQLWTPVGATDQGWKFGSNKSTQPINIEEQSANVKTTMTTQVFTVEGVAAEDISRTLAIVYNMYITMVASGVGMAGYERMNLTDDILEYAVALIMANKAGYPRWLYVPSTTCLGDVDTTLRRASAKRMYNAVFTSDCDISAIQLLNVVSAGS